MEYDAPGKCDICNVTLEKIEEKETHIHNHHHEKHEPQEHNHEPQKHEGHQEHEKHIHYDHEEHKEHTNHNYDEHYEHKEHIHHDHADHHRQMVRDFKKRFIISALVTIPILLLSPLVQQLFNFRFSFLGEKYVLFVLSSFIFFYGGWPFLEGFFNESKKKQPGMMTLIALAISVAYFYSSAVVFGLEGTGEESYLTKVINLVKEAQSSKSKTQRFADKAER